MLCCIEMGTYERKIDQNGKNLEISKIEKGLKKKREENKALLPQTNDNNCVYHVPLSTKLTVNLWTMQRQCNCNVR